MKKKLFILLASCSLVATIILPIATGEPLVTASTQMLIQTMGHGTGGG